MRSLLKNFILFSITFLVIIGLVSAYATSRSEVKRVGLDALVAAIEGQQVQKITVKDSATVLVTLKDGSHLAVAKEPTESFPTLLKNYGLDGQVIRQLPLEVAPASGWSFWLSTLLPIFLPLLLFGLLMYFMMRQVQGMNNRAMMFGQSGARELLERRRDCRPPIPMPEATKWRFPDPKYGSQLFLQMRWERWRRENRFDAGPLGR